ncbi:MAG: DUF5615 family PIN-like protein [Planctomycetes bacterium]|nr:DUF5615 family PIN-like protein [Planctomycetota bacterium]
MKFLIDRCIGAQVCEWLKGQGHDALYAPELGPDPGDESLLQTAHDQGRILITIDKDFGAIVYVQNQPHAGIIRMPDVSTVKRIALVSTLLRDYSVALAAGAMITIRGERIRVSRESE